MFGFMKKDKDREDDKKKKKEKKDSKRSKERPGMTREELWRLDEARKSLTGKGKKKKEEKLPSGITADYMDQFLSGLQKNSDPDIAAANTFREIRERYEAMASASGVQSDSSSDGVSLQSLRAYMSQHASPPKRGILKGGGSTEYQGVQGNIDDDASLMLNTNYNEIYENFTQRQLDRAESQSSVQDRSSLSSPQRVSNGSLSLSPRSPLSPTLLSPSGSHPLGALISTNMLSQIVNREQPPPLPSSLSSTMHPHAPAMTYQMHNFTGGMPVGESAGMSHHSMKNFDADLCLPALIPYELPPPRTLAIDRLPAGDFGFSLRRTQVLERVANRPPTKRTIIFAEPGSVGRTNTTGLLPGDRLLQVNGISVENKSREEIIELIKASADYVTLMVQPVKELSELSVRQCVDGRQVALNDDQIHDGTLRRQPKHSRNVPLIRTSGPRP
ncbi:uncharacterized protein LOC108665249, partial [Hyalella azteca]|uniref:Uncharacterized protein LOC108665249 n=1 Tax=Hyalella azteca TaxID=294128 RepID=A0A8B7N2N3_HYAAZ